MSRGRTDRSRRRPDPAALAEYPVRVEIPVRWGDMDAFGHVNNTVFFRYLESARIAYLDAIAFRASRGIGPILAETRCRFLRPLAYPDRVRVGARAARVEEDRFTHEYLVVSERLEAVAAVGEGLIVSYDYERRVKAPLPADVRERIEALARDDGAGLPPG